jgi:hypothetical protein
VNWQSWGCVDGMNGCFMTSFVLIHPAVLLISSSEGHPNERENSGKTPHYEQNENHQN